MIEKLVAVNEYVFLIKDEAERKYGSIVLPEGAEKKVNTGKIISVGKNVFDRNIKKGSTAIFNKQVGSEIEIFDTNITVLNGNTQILGVV